ncbi:hypothetical protein RE428_00610 [Marinobacter nanhaiticus D15-8W]|uniref:Entry exclusion lipoprotein TrbK n=1 Tax=Marinobacter nanhaiticus D15-8W TaxID=626887 RepID=N6VYD9_9GAMM|nr:hypothetical protein [Marinobacter nanhaiticus]ENO15255.2 hypothetical protein J057_07891 [Marinobacter nanhaiticus D15-8W]BES69043.1 hypothetical protein RE428_00610 [Marinobacter nanhaiticus D15-8W]
MKLLCVLLSLVVLVGCSNRAVYDNIQLNQRNECFKLPPSQRSDCLDSIDKSYDEYRKEREEIVDDEVAA